VYPVQTVENFFKPKLKKTMKPTHFSKFIRAVGLRWNSLIAHNIKGRSGKKHLAPMLGAFFLLLSFPEEGFSYCILKKINGGFGNTCDEPVNNNILSVGIGYGYQKNQNIDGGLKNKNDKGSKSKYQGYAEYRRNFIYYGWEFIASPHQKATRSSNSENRSFGYEYAFNPFLSAKIQQQEVFFNGFDPEEEIKHRHTFVLLNLRIYLLDALVFRSGLGIGEGEFKRKGSDVDSENGKFSGQTNVAQMSLFYIFGDESLMLGITQTTIDGEDNDKENIGISNYGLVASVGF
jgi:hypothetical protein